MKEMFRGYYRPSQKELQNLWETCIFVQDANVLLNLYRYTSDTREKLVEIFEKIGPRLWVSHQAALEYQRNRLDVISKQRQAYSEIEQLLEDSQKKLQAALRSYTRHPLIDADKVMGPITAAFVKQTQELEAVRQQHPDLIENDEVRGTLTKLLDGKVGPPYKDDALKQIFKEADERYAKGIPPGFSDVKTKTGNQKFGDYVLWLQVLDKAATDKCPVIIVTDDVKEDWWWKHEGKVVGPRPELVEEMKSKAGVGFYMYRSDQFMEHAKKYLKQSIDQNVIEEIRSVRKRDEEVHRELQEALIEEIARLDERINHTISEERSIEEMLGKVLNPVRDSAQGAEFDQLIQSLLRKREAFNNDLRELTHRREYLEHTRRLPDNVAQYLYDWNTSRAQPPLKRDPRRPVTELANPSRPDHPKG